MPPPTCHPERSEGSVCLPLVILSAAKDLSRGAQDWRETHDRFHILKVPVARKKFDSDHCNRIMKFEEDYEAEQI